MPSTRFRLVVSIAALLLAVGLPLSTAFAPPVYGGTLIVGLADDPPQLDPHLTTANASRTVLHNIFATLVEIDAQMQIVPASPSRGACRTTACATPSPSRPTWCSTTARPSTPRQWPSTSRA